MVGVAVVGDVMDINCWSNIPFYFYSSGSKLGIFHKPWRVNVSKLVPYRYLWNGLQFVTHGSVGGFQYSKLFLELLERQIPFNDFRSTVISFNQLFPRASRVVGRGGKIFYYLDATLYDLFHSPTYNLNVPEKIQRSAIALEKENYALCEAVVTMGNWIHETLENVYQVPRHKLFHILPGANFELPDGFKFTSSSRSDSNNIVLGFVGKDWKRKGLPLLRQVQLILLQKGYQVVIKIIGQCPDELRKADHINYCGFINKQTDTLRFIEEIASCDIGCLFSEDEALGISVLEFLRVGVPVAGFFHQGLKDTLLEGASFRFHPDTTAQTIADTFEQFINDKTLKDKMKKKAEYYSSYVTWERCVKEWEQLLNRT